MCAKADLCVLFGGALVVVLCKACSHEKNVSDLDVATLCSWADIDALILANFDQIVV